MATRTCPRRLPARLSRHLRDARDRRGRARDRGRAAIPDHPITAGFLCGKVSNYLDRVYSRDRILHPLVRDGRRGEFRRALWDEALDASPDGLAARARRVGGESILPYSYMGTQGLIQGDVDERPGHERARRERPRAHDLRHRRHHRDGDDPRRLARGRPGGVAERPLRARLGLEPDVDRAAPVAEAARRARATARGWWSSTRSAAAPRGWPTSTCARCRAPTPRWRSG